MISPDSIIPLVAILATFGPVFYVIYLTGKLIKYRIDKKYNSVHSEVIMEMKRFMERTDHRLRALEEIASQDDDITLKEPQKKSDSGQVEIAPEEDKDSDLSEDPKSKLKNQLKS